MNKINPSIFFVFALLFISFSCSSDSQKEYSEEEIEQELSKYTQRAVILEQNGIKISEVLDYPAFDEVQLGLLTRNAKFKPGKNKLEFVIEKFVLGERTAEEHALGIKIHEGGQNFTIIDAVSGIRFKNLSNYIETDFKEGENYLFAFLNRSNGIGIKNKNSQKLYRVFIGKTDSAAVEESSLPCLFVAAPEENEVFSKDTKILLDFYPLNIHFSKEEYIELKVNNSTFKLYNDSPYTLEGLDYGKHTLSLKIIGNQQKSPLKKEAIFSIEVAEKTLFE